MVKEINDEDITNFKKKFALLEEFKNEHGDCDVPDDHPELGRWVKNIRTRYQRGGLKKNYPEGVEKLTELGFDFSGDTFSKKKMKMRQQRKKENDSEDVQEEEEQREDEEEEEEEVSNDKNTDGIKKKQIMRRMKKKMEASNGNIDDATKKQMMRRMMKQKGKA